MTEKKYNLPEYPCVEDVWDILAKEKRPIAVYGMGNGADKLFQRFEKYAIKVSEVFASDGFVRGHSYRGFKVKSFSDVKAEYSEFVIVLSFASNKEDVIKMLEKIDAEYEMYIPDMPVADEAEYFDREFYNTHYEKIQRVYGMLADERSRSIYSAVINYRLTGKMKYLIESCSEREEMYSLLDRNSIKTVVDAGAYNGDTAREAIEQFPNLERIYAIEPDARNYKKLLKFSELCDREIIPINSAVWSECRLGMFAVSGNRNSSVSSTASYKHSDVETELITIDSLGIESANYIKYDVEGAEYEALLGSQETIQKLSPELLISLYHRSADIFVIPEYISRKYPQYSLYIRRLRSIPAWELNLIAVVNNKKS